jgi:PAS domain S-box-containing protein
MMLDRDLFEFLEHTSDAAFAVTDAGEICSWNSSAEALFGLDQDEVLG